MTKREAWDRYKPLMPYGITLGMLLVVFGAGGWVRGTDHDVRELKAQVPAKVDTAEYRRDVRELKAKLDSLAFRQQQFFCANEPNFCR